MRSEVRSKMEGLNELIGALLSKNGRFQLVLILLLSLNSISIGINHTITSFHTYVPRYFCQDDDRAELTPDQCEVRVNGTQCPGGYKFDTDDDRTIVVEWSLICDRRLLAPLINTLYFVGVTIGALICSTLADLWGRKKLVLTCLYAQAALSVGLYFSQSLEMFIIFRIVQGFFIQGLQTCSYTLMLEYCPARYRTAAAVLWEINWAIGLSILGVAAYFIRSWRVLTLVLTIPAGLSVLYCWLFPESITWLYAKGRHREAFELVQKIAQQNNDTTLLEECNKIEMERKTTSVSPLITGTRDEMIATSGTSSLLDVWRCKVLRKHLIVMICVWFSVTLSYYGILYFLPNLAGQRHVNFLVGATIEIVAYILAYFVLSRYGRRIPLAMYQFVNGILCIAMGLIALAPDSSAQNWFLIVIALIAKGLAVSNFCGMFIYCSELFPTICRGVALGLCGFAARCGSLLAPQLMILIYYVPSYVPMTIMALLIIITGSATIMLPETLSTELPNTIREAVDLWEK